jgi:hypothetical protein
MVLGGIPRPAPPVFAHTLAHAIRQATCAPGVPAPAVCDRVLGVGLTVPKGWSVVPREKFPPGYLAFWTLIPGNQAPPSHLVIEPVGLASACTDTQAALAVAEALARTTTSAHPILRARYEEEALRRGYERSLWLGGKGQALNEAAELLRKVMSPAQEKGES